MTKKERLRLNTIHVIGSIQRNFNVSEDFYDDEGRGYFIFGVIKDNVEYRFDMYRRDFTIISYKLRNEKGYEEANKLEKELEEFIKEALINSNKLIGD